LVANAGLNVCRPQACNFAGLIPEIDIWRAATLMLKRYGDKALEIVKRSDDIKGFVVLPRRWAVERTFSWFGRNRRLAKDFENLAETLTTFVTLASIQLALPRLARA
jgi:transposase